MDADPLYLTIEEAASYTGIGESAMRSYVNSVDPPPMLVIGNKGGKRLIERAGLVDYLRGKQNYVFSEADGHSVGKRIAPLARG